ncbi:hypothetical protein LX16_4271 [Stackebrandtia albiflava]|uniref:DUF4878 domain-containing protein n=2 Tax=Stackebrandtia albiflava TaxID=406432 RepID=A0A562UZ43_9ACTN|nr:hypothetical protein LX16_4271 [Stackebrandtia albiflava]
MPSPDPSGWPESRQEPHDYPDRGSAGTEYRFDSPVDGYTPGQHSAVPASPGAPQYGTPGYPTSAPPGWAGPPPGHPPQHVPQYPQYQPPVPPPKSQAGLFVGLGLGLLVIIAVVIVVIAANSGGSSGTTADDTDATTALTPTQVVDGYYQGLKNHDVDAILATLCQVEVNAYNADPYTEEELETELWSLADASSYEITREEGADTAEARVYVDVTYQGQTSVTIAVLQKESDAWKICRWEYQ